MLTQEKVVFKNKLKTNYKILVKTLTLNVVFYVTVEKLL